MEWLLMEIAPSYDLESSPATCPGIPLLEPCRHLLVQGDLTFSGLWDPWEAWPEGHGLAPGFPPESRVWGQVLSQEGPGVEPVKGVSALVLSSQGRSPSTQGNLGQGRLTLRGLHGLERNTRWVENEGSEKCCREGRPCCP